MTSLIIYQALACVKEFPLFTTQSVVCLYILLLSYVSLTRQRPGLFLCFSTCSTHYMPTFHLCSTVSRHSTSKLSWSECMDFKDTQTHIVTDLEGLKRFFNQGLDLRIEEEKVQKRRVDGVNIKMQNVLGLIFWHLTFQILSWPAASEGVTVARTSVTVKEKKGRKGKEVSSSFH